MDQIVKIKVNQEVVGFLKSITDSWENFKTLLDKDGKVWWIDSGCQKIFLEFDLERQVS